MNKPTSKGLFMTLVAASAFAASFGTYASEAVEQELVPLSGTAMTQSGIEIVHSAGMPLGEAVPLEGDMLIFQGLLSEVVAEATGSGITTVDDDCEWLSLKLSDDGGMLLADVSGRDGIVAYLYSLTGKVLSSHALRDGLNAIAVPKDGGGAIIVSFSDKGRIIKSFKLTTRR